MSSVLEKFEELGDAAASASPRCSDLFYEYFYFVLAVVHVIVSV